MKIVLFSDLHLFAASVGVAGQGTALARAVEHVNEHHREAALCIALGDLTTDGLPEEYRALAGELDRLHLPCHLMIGNHDRRPAFLEVFGRDRANADGFVQVVVDSGALRFLLLDTTSAAGDHGELDERRLGWLEKELALTDRPCCICLHHQPVATGVPAYDAIGLRSDQFTGLLTRYRKAVHLVLHGHCHMALSGSIAGIPLAGVESLVNQAHPNFLDDRFIGREYQCISYTVVLTDGRRSIIHTIDVGKIE
jgi:3',5'-cyclic-AMP phosphodiesterase